MSITRIEFAPKVVLDPKPETPVQVRLASSPQMLVQLGAHIPVVLSPPSALHVGEVQPVPHMVFGHIDTGASRTCVDVNLANALALPQTGFAESHTASGRQTSPTFAADLLFPTMGQKLLRNVNLGSCLLPYKAEERPSPRNFGILIGRDILAGCVLIWDGAKSSVTITC